MKLNDVAPEENHSSKVAENLLNEFHCFSARKWELKSPTTKLASSKGLS